MVEENNETNEILVITPRELKDKYLLTEKAEKIVFESKRTIFNILDRKDDRLLIVTGPCSIHDVDEAIECADKVKKLSYEVDDKIFLVMRTYFEKPRTTIGWKGILYDPDHDNTHYLDKGLKLTRKLLLDISEIGIPCGTEFLNPFFHKYIGDLVSWAAIGAKTSESPIHREFSSDLTMPTGFKNNINGDIGSSVNSLISSKSPHYYLGISEDGRASFIKSKGNRYVHIILRGGLKPNYDSKSVKISEELLDKNGLMKNIMIDCSHGNSSKDYRKQPEVCRDVLNQRLTGNKNIFGIMFESNLLDGKQEITGNDYGISKTDSCMGWRMTEDLIREVYDNLNSEKIL